MIKLLFIEILMFINLLIRFVDLYSQVVLNQVLYSNFSFIVCFKIKCNGGLVLDKDGIFFVEYCSSLNNIRFILSFFE